MIAALKKLELDYAVHGTIGMLDYAMRRAILVSRIDEARTVVADKAATLYGKADNGQARALQIWLHDQPVDVIVGAEGPCVTCSVSDLFQRGFLALPEYPAWPSSKYTGPFRAYPEGERVDAIEWDVFFPSGILHAERDSLCADAAEWLFMRMTYNNIWNYLRAAGPHAIKALARADLEKYNAKRQVTADKAEALCFVFRHTENWLRGYPERIGEHYKRFTEKRRASADKAQTLADLGISLNSIVYASQQGDI